MPILPRIFPEQFDFFALFEEASQLAVTAIDKCQQLFANVTSGGTLFEDISALETKADDVAHRTLTLLHQTFITPLDREHILRLIRLLDDIVDLTDAACQRLGMYNIQTVPLGFCKIIEINRSCVGQVDAAVRLLRSMKNAKELLARSIELNRLENDADLIFRKTLTQLFAEVSDVKLLIQLKEILEILERVSDTCEEVAHLVETIVLEYS